jgi:hypothetical protein
MLTLATSPISPTYCHRHLQTRQHTRWAPLIDVMDLERRGNGSVECNAGMGHKMSDAGSIKMLWTNRKNRTSDLFALSPVLSLH